MNKITTLILTLLFFSFQVFSQQVKFNKNISWAKIIEMAKKENKPIFVDAYTDWCYWCKVMDKKTFTNSEVANTLNKKFIAVKINAEKDEGIEFAAKFKILGYPTVLFFNPNGELVKNQAGYLDVETFLTESRNVLENGNAISEIDGKTLKVGFPKFYINAYDPSVKQKVTQTEVDAFLNKQKDLFDEVSWAVMYRFPLNEEHITHFLMYKEEYIAKYGKDEVTQKVKNIASERLQKAIKNDAENELAITLKYIEANFEKETIQKTQIIYKLRFYEQTGKWNKFASIFDPLSNKAGPDEINSYVWSIYESCDNEVVIKKAVHWMKIAIEKEESYAILDTYAAILYKAKSNQEAEIWAEKAIKLGEEQGENVKETVSLLEKIKSKK